MKVGDLLINKTGNHTAICLEVKPLGRGLRIKVYTIKTKKTFWISGKAYEVINEKED